MTTLAETLAACPGCNGTRTRVIGGPGTKGGPKYWAGCDVCHWRTWGDTEAEAIAEWNLRSPEFAELQRKAERYDWLRDQLLWAPSYDGRVRWIVELTMPEPDISAGHAPVALSLDTAIDQAIAQAGAAGGGGRG